MKIAFILLIGFALCRSAEVKNDCTWYSEDLPLKELNNNGYICANYECSDDGKLKQLQGCPLVKLAPCEDGTYPQGEVDDEKPYPYCCPHYICKA